MEKQKLVVLSGAGISAPSGIKTFRDSDGLWEGHEVQEVASPMGFHRNPSLVIKFYNDRRRDIANAKPNKAHIGLANLENKYAVEIVTQNVDDLHERGGSTNVIHLHGEIFKMCSTKNKQLTYPILGDMTVGEKAPDGGLLRPYIVWFGEEVPLIEVAARSFENADIIVVIGTSLQVYPAAGLLDFVPADVPIYVVDKQIPAMHWRKNVVPVQSDAETGMEKLIGLLGKH